MNCKQCGELMYPGVEQSKNVRGFACLKCGTFTAEQPGRYNWNTPVVINLICPYCGERLQVYKDVRRCPKCTYIAAGAASINLPVVDSRQYGRPTPKSIVEELIQEIKNERKNDND